MAEFLLTRGHGDSSRIFDTLREGQTILKCCGRAHSWPKMHFPAVKLSHRIEITGRGGFVLPGCLTRSSLQSQLWNSLGACCLVVEE